MEHNNNLIIVKDSFIVILDSRNATTNNNDSFNSDVYFEFDDPLKVETSTLQWSASVLTFTCPNSIYVINETNSFLCVVITSPSFINLSYTFPYGNYNVSSFINAFNSVFKPLSLSINTITNIFTIIGTNLNFYIDPSSTIYGIMGFRKNSSIFSNNYQIIMPFTCNFNGLQNLNIHLSSITTKNINSFTSSTCNIIQSIPIQCGSNQILYTKANDYNFNITTQILDSLNIQLKDDLGNLINLNNQNFNLTLVFNTLKNMDRFKNDTTLLGLVKYANHAGIGAYEA